MKIINPNKNQDQSQTQGEGRIIDVTDFKEIKDKRAMRGLVFKYRVAILCLMAVMLSGALSVWIHFELPTRIVQFDMQATVKLYSTEVAQSHLTKAQRTVKSRYFAESLQEAAAEYAQLHHVIVLVSPAVVAGAPDVTAEIQQLTLQLMRGAK